MPHSTLFAVKRTFHKFTWWTRDYLDRFGITPSRYDILYILETRGSPVWQSTIRRILGVTGATTSVLLQALEGLRLIVRKRSDTDRRQVEVTITSLGAHVFEKVRNALDLSTGMGVIHDGVANMLRLSGEGTQIAWQRIADFDATLMRMRRRLGDVARLVYRWLPDEWTSPDLLGTWHPR